MSRQLVLASSWAEIHARPPEWWGVQIRSLAAQVQSQTSQVGQHLGYPGSGNLAVAWGQMLKHLALQALEFGLDSGSSEEPQNVLEQRRLLNQTP